MTREEVKEIMVEVLSEFFTGFSELTKAEASRVLGVSRPTIYRMIESGELKTKGNKVLIKK